MIRLLQLLVIVFLVGGLSVLSINFYVHSFSTKYIVSLDKPLPQTDAILVLGAYFNPNTGKPSDMLEDRLATAYEIYTKNPDTKIIVSGDHGRKDYDEVNGMKDYLMAKGVPDEYIFMDHAGFSTYESMYRAKEIFQVQSLTVVTQDYHLYRAIFDSRKMGIESYGVIADKRYYPGMNYYKLREVAARNKDFLYALVKPEPTFLGEPIPVWSNGQLTNDR